MAVEDVAAMGQSFDYIAQRTLVEIVAGLLIELRWKLKLKPRSLKEREVPASPSFGAIWCCTPGQLEQQYAI